MLRCLGATLKKGLGEGISEFGRGGVGERGEAFEGGEIDRNEHGELVYENGGAVVPRLKQRQSTDRCVSRSRWLTRARPPAPSALTQRPRWPRTRRGIPRRSCHLPLMSFVSPRSPSWILQACEVRAEEMPPGCSRGM